MASHGIVYDLFDDRYLELQDVAGIVESLPTLVPYEQYSEHMLVYRMNTGPELFMALLQDFTRRRSVETRKELWTWCVQWKVDEAATHQQVTPPHSPKKPRLAAPPIKGRVREINPQLMVQREILRILLDILQVGSHVVPNFIEFLYRMIDYYEGDGKALKAALHKEIPSLWAFDYHPLIFPRDVKKIDEGMNSKSNIEGAEGLAQTSQTRINREKPDLAALHRKVEESERLQYREVHFGIQPPKIKEPLPPLINIPRDPVKRVKFHSACFQSRQRAYNLLIEAGMTPQQMRDYQRTQEEDPRDTPQAFGRDGLQFYRKDAELAQKVHTKQDKHLDKGMEIAISEKLAFEAQFAHHGATPEDFFGVPLIPNRPVPAVVAARSENIYDEMLRKIRENKDRAEMKINTVPLPLVGKLRGKLFEGAMGKQTLLRSWENLVQLRIPPFTNTYDEGESETGITRDSNMGENGHSNHYDSDENGSTTGDGLDIPLRLAPPRPLSIPGQPPMPLPPYSNSPTVPNNSPYMSALSTGLMGLQPLTPGRGGLSLPVTAPIGTPAFTSLAEFVRNLTPEQARGIVLMSNLQARQEPSSMFSPTRDPSLPVPPPYHPVERPAFAVTLSAPAPASAFSQHLAAIQQGQGNPTSGQGAHNVGPPVSRGPGQSDFSSYIQRYLQNQQLPFLAPNSFLAPPLPGIQRSAPSPLRLAPSSSALDSFTPSLTGASPNQHPKLGMPVQIYFPGVLVPGNLIGPGGAMMGNKGNAETDAFLVGYSQPGSGKITLSHAIFLPVGVWANCANRVGKDKYSVLETYIGPVEGRPQVTTPVPHRAAYDKLRQAHSLMMSPSSAAREENLTKRWRVSQGKMSAAERGAVWEGWAVGVDKEISMSREEREGALIYQDYISLGVDMSEQRARRRKEIEELLEEEESWEYYDDVEMEG